MGVDGDFIAHPVRDLLHHHRSHGAGKQHARAAKAQNDQREPGRACQEFVLAEPGDNHKRIARNLAPIDNLIDTVEPAYAGIGAPFCAGSARNRWRSGKRYPSRHRPDERAGVSRADDAIEPGQRHDAGLAQIDGPVQGGEEIGIDGENEHACEAASRLVEPPGKVERHAPGGRVLGRPGNEEAAIGIVPLEHETVLARKVGGVGARSQRTCPDGTVRPHDCGVDRLTGELRRKPRPLRKIEAAAVFDALLDSLHRPRNAVQYTPYLVAEGGRKVRGGSVAGVKRGLAQLECHEAHDGSNRDDNHGAVEHDPPAKAAACLLDHAIAGYPATPHIAARIAAQALGGPDAVVSGGVRHVLPA